jgi:hypothetical protein
MTDSTAWHVHVAADGDWCAQLMRDNSTGCNLLRHKNTMILHACFVVPTHAWHNLAIDDELLLQGMGCQGN